MMPQATLSCPTVPALALCHDECFAALKVVPSHSPYLSTSMLDLRHPLTQHIFRASGLIDRIMEFGQKMSVSPTPKRIELLHECRPLFDELRNLACQKFTSDQLSLLEAISEYESAITALASVQTHEDRSSGVGECGVCGTPLLRFQPTKGIKEYEDRWIICCHTCSAAYMRAKAALSSGFGTDCI